jgi:RNase P/RNase MRP subunit POP5
MALKKMKLLPSARDNRRYFVCNSQDKEKIERAILDYIGVLGFARANFMFLEVAGKVLGSCKRESLEDIRASLAWRGIKIQKVSGTIAGLEIQ